MNEEANDTTTGESNRRQKRLPGPVRRYLDPSKRAQIIELVTTGHGRQGACLEAGVTFRTFRNTIEKYPSFLADIQDATEASRQKTEKIAKELADVADRDVLPIQLARIDNARKLAQAREDHLASKEGGASEANLVAVAYRVAALFAPHVPSDKGDLLMEKVPKLVEEILNGIGKHRNSPA